MDEKKLYSRVSWQKTKILAYHLKKKISFSRHSNCHKLSNLDTLQFWPYSKACGGNIIILTVIFAISSVSIVINLFLCVTTILFSSHFYLICNESLKDPHLRQKKSTRKSLRTQTNKLHCTKYKKKKYNKNNEFLFS